MVIIGISLHEKVRNHSYWSTDTWGMTWTYRPQLLVVTHNRVRAHRLLAQYFAQWQISFAAFTLQAWQRVAAPLLAIIDRASRFDTRDSALVAQLRQVFPGVRAVVLVADCNSALVNAAQLVAAETLVLVNAEPNLRCLGEWRPARLREAEECVERLQDENGITDRERDVATLAILGYRRDEIAMRLGISPNSVRTLVRRILKRTGARRLADLRMRGRKTHV